MSILRSSKFVKYFVSFARNIIIAQPKNVDKSLLERSKSLITISDERSFTEVAGTNPNYNVIERSIQRLDNDVRRSGRVSRKELLDVFDEIRHSHQASSTQSLMIIRCCGSLVPEERPEIRTKLVNEIWETFEKIGVAMDISHYNALLRVYLENEHHFSPSEFLAMLENKGVEPNRVTFQRIILAYCQRGDIEGATSVLEFMKEKQIPVNESVFNALIVGHSQSDDMESAAGILGVMRQTNIEPSADTYTALLCGHARRGDIDSINAVFQECKDKSVELLDKDILEVMFTLAVNNHPEHLDVVLEQLRRVVGYNQDAKNIILRLIVRGEEDAAFKVFKTMTPLPIGSSDSCGAFLIKQMVRSNRPVERIVSFCKILKESGENEYALHQAVETSLLGANPELSLQLLSALASQDKVCQHYYWPILVKFGKANNTQGLFATLQQLTREVGQPVSGETLKDYVLPYMKPSEQSILDLRQGGVTVASAAAASVANLLSNNNMKEATRIALQYRAKYNSVTIKRSLVNAFLATKDVTCLITMVRVLRDSDKEDEDVVVEEVLSDIATSMKGKDRAKMIQEILQGYLDHGFGLSKEVAESLQDSLRGEELTHEISTILSKLTSTDLIPKELDRPFKRFAVDKKNEESLIAAIKAGELKGTSTNSLIRDLIILYSRNKELVKAQELINKLNEEGFEFNFGLLSVILDLYINSEMLTEATEVYNNLCKLEKDEELDENKVVKYALLLAKHEKVEEAMSLFTKHKAKSDPNTREFSYASSCWKLLNFFAEKGHVKLLKDLFDTMKNEKFLEPNNVLLGPLIKVHLVNDDLVGALDQFEECCTLYRSTPWKNDIACRLIQNEDAASLQRLTDLSTQIHGEINSLYDLVLSFVECGRIRQARKILETPGLRARTQRINSACEKYTNEGKVNHLENLVEATKDIGHIDRADIYYHLLLTYCKFGEVDKAMGLWTQMQDEDVQPTDQFLITLGSLLKENNRPIPFAIPEVKDSLQAEFVTEKNMLSSSKLSILRSLRRAMYGKELDEALELKNRLTDAELSPFDRAKLLNLLVNSGRLREGTQMLINWFENKLAVNSNAISNLTNTLAKLGDVDSLESVGKHLDKEMKKVVSFTNRYTHGMVEAGRAEEVLTKLLDSINNAKTPQDFINLMEEFPRGGMFPILNAHPEYLPKVEEIATKYRERGLLEPSNVLWIHFTLDGNETKAEEYWNYLKPSERLMFLPILNNARIQQNDQILVNLLKKCKDAKVPPPALSPIYGGLLDLYLLKNQEDECEKLFQEAVQVCTAENLNRRTLLRLKKAFEAKGKEFNYKIPSSKAKEKSSAISSSSSSDSDADQPKK